MELGLELDKIENKIGKNGSTSVKKCKKSVVFDRFSLIFGDPL